MYVGDSLVARTLRSLFRDRLTLTGRAVFWLFMLANLTGMFSFVVKVYFVWSALGSLLLVSAVAARFSRVPLTLDVSWPTRATAGGRVPVKLNVRNDCRRVARDVSLKPWKLPWPLECEPAELAELAPGEACTLTWELALGRRGHYVLAGLRQDTSFPFGLWNDVLTLPQPQGLLVYPQFVPLHRLDIPVGRRYQPGGIALTSHLGDSTEFLSTREFREGDSIRMIHWRSWARTGTPVVKEFQEEFFCRIALLVDTFVPPQQLKRARDVFEAAVSLSAAVADNLAREEYVIDVFAAGPEIYHFQAGRSLAYLENVMDILACIEPCPEAPFEKIEPVLLECLENITTTVVIMLDWDERRERMLQLIRDRGSGVKAILVRDEPPSRDLAGLEALVGSYVWVGSEQVRSGVTDL